MTTPEAAALYLAQHNLEYAGRRNAIYNPNDFPLHELPRIYGFNNGGSPGWMEGQLISQDGHLLGGHICSHEGYMRADLGILEGTRPDRHEKFRAHYPGGYVMEFISYGDAANHPGLKEAYRLLDARMTEGGKG